jgi:hypothetical protein
VSPTYCRDYHISPTSPTNIYNHSTYIKFSKAIYRCIVIVTIICIMHVIMAYNQGIIYVCFCVYSICLHIYVNLSNFLSIHTFYKNYILLILFIFKCIYDHKIIILFCGDLYKTYVVLLMVIKGDWQFVNLSSVAKKG